MASRIFVSYNFNDRNISYTVKSRLQGSGGLVQGIFLFVVNDVSFQGDLAIDLEIRQTMSGCDAALFIVGNNNHNSPWINREAELAISRGLNIVVTKLPETSGGIPNILNSSNYTLAEWSGNDISYYLNHS